MPIKFGQAREILAPFAGVSGLDPSSKTTELFVRKVLQYMLFSGASGDTRVFSFYAVQGVITLPYELEVPLKIKVGNEAGDVWGKWFDFKPGVLKDCIDADAALQEDPNVYPTVYDLPSGGGHPAFLGTADEAPDAHVIVCGPDLSGREIVTTHKGEEIIGEYVCIQKGRLIATRQKFGAIKSITKTRTKGYVQCFSVNSQGRDKRFLSDYAPYEEIPQYRRCKLTAPCNGKIVKVDILGRIRLKEYYADSDVVPFDNLAAMEFAGQSLQAHRTDDVQTADAKDKTMLNMLNRESSQKQVNNGQPLVDVFRPLSFGSIRKRF